MDSVSQAKLAITYFGTFRACCSLVIAPPLRPDERRARVSNDAPGGHLNGLAGFWRDVLRYFSESRSAPIRMRLLSKARPAKPTASKAHEESSGTGSPAVIWEITISAPPSEA